jgi:hypothetical protein
MENITTPQASVPPQANPPPKNIKVLFIIFLIIIFTGIGLLGGYFLGKNNIVTQKYTETTNVTTKTEKIKPTEPQTKTTLVEKPMEFTNSYNKSPYQLTVSLPSNWTIVKKPRYENDQNSLAYILASKDNTSVLTIAYLSESVGWPLPTGAVVVKKVNTRDEIIREYGKKSGPVLGYYYHTNQISPAPEFKLVRMSSGLWIGNGDKFIVLQVYLVYSGVDADKDKALEVSDKIVSSIVLK